LVGARGARPPFNITVKIYDFKNTDEGGNLTDSYTDGLISSYVLYNFSYTMSVLSGKTIQFENAKRRGCNSPHINQVLELNYPEQHRK